MGPNPNGPLSVSYDRAIRYLGFFGVRDPWVLLEISLIDNPESSKQWVYIMGVPL